MSLHSPHRVDNHSVKNEKWLAIFPFEIYNYVEQAALSPSLNTVWILDGSSNHIAAGNWSDSYEVWSSTVTAQCLLLWTMIFLYFHISQQGLRLAWVALPNCYTQKHTNLDTNVEAHTHFLRGVFWSERYFLISENDLIRLWVRVCVSVSVYICKVVLKEE